MEQTARSSSKLFRPKYPSVLKDKFESVTSTPLLGLINNSDLQIISSGKTCLIPYAKIGEK